MVTQERTLVPYFWMKAKSSGQGTLVAHQLTQSLIKLSCERILKQFIIVDGLDECPKEERHILLSFLAEIIDKTEDDEPGKLRVLIVSQAEADIAETLSKDCRARPNLSVQQFAIQQRHNKDEIEIFVKMWTDRIAEKFNLSVEETEFIQRMMSERTAGMGLGPERIVSTHTTAGMFLYAKLVLENLYKQVTKSDLVAELDEQRFPVGLHQA
jgi:hypothetical protein